MNQKQTAFIEAFIELVEDAEFDRRDLVLVLQMMNGYQSLSERKASFLITLKALVGREKLKNVPAELRWAVSAIKQQALDKL